MKNDIKNMGIIQLKNRKYELERIINICTDYLASAYNTFLGPMGARAEIRRCKKELALINSEIKEHYSNLP